MQKAIQPPDTHIKGYRQIGSALINQLSIILHTYNNTYNNTLPSNLMGRKTEIQSIKIHELTTFKGFCIFFGSKKKTHSLEKTNFLKVNLSPLIH